jgi:hypothetical protein
MMPQADQQRNVSAQPVRVEMALAAAEFQIEDIEAEPER